VEGLVGESVGERRRDTRRSFWSVLLGKDEMDGGRKRQRGNLRVAEATRSGTLGMLGMSEGSLS